MTEDPRFYQIALTLINGIGSSHIRELIRCFGDAEALFHQSKKTLQAIPSVGPALSDAVNDHTLFLRAEKELDFIDKNDIRIYCIQDEDYPKRLRECNDAPYIFFFKGNADLNASYVISIVGTRMATDYGKSVTEKFVAGLAEKFPNLLVVSGLAYGIDISSHRAALANGLPTVAVLGHGLDRIYPFVHRQTATEMQQNGGLLTEFLSGTDPDRPNFVRRNRIVAGLSDATIVVESAEKGGSLITAEMALSYQRELYAFPGRTDDPHSKGCNQLIRKNKAGLITSAEEFIEAMGWDDRCLSVKVNLPQQTKLLFPDKEEYRQVVDLLQQNKEMHVNQLSVALSLPMSQLSNILFDMEMEGLIKNMPGNIYRLN